MYYIIQIKHLVDPFKRGLSWQRIILTDLLSDYDCVIPVREFLNFACLGLRTFKNWQYDKLYMLYDSDNNNISIVTDDCKTIHVAPFKLCFLQLRSSRFLLRVFHDNDKTLPSFRAVCFFLHDLSSGVSPLELWRKYCWMRTFDYLPLIDNNYDGTVLDDAAF